MSEVKTVKVWVLKYWETSGVSIVECDAFTRLDEDTHHCSLAPLLASLVTRHEIPGSTCPLRKGAA